MGLDQRIWAEIKVRENDARHVAIHYWRKDYRIDEWFFDRLPKARQDGINAEDTTAWSCVVTIAELDLLEANDFAVALKIGFHPELIWRCRWAVAEGFTLSYSRSS